MKKLLTIILVAGVAICKGQDLTIDLPTARESFQSYNFYVAAQDTEFLCMGEGYYIVGDNFTVSSTSLICNMGVTDVVLVDTSNSYLDPCHGHIHTDLLVVEILDSCGNVVESVNKVGYALANTDYYGYFINSRGQIESSWTEAQREWLERFAPLPDSSTAYILPTDTFSYHGQQGLSPYRGDAYPFTTEGQWNHMENQPNGIYFQRYRLTLPDWINQGANIYPDTIVIPFRYENHVAILLPESVVPAYCNVITDTIPESITAMIIGNGNNILGNREVTITGVDFPITIYRHWVRGRNTQQGGIPLTISSNTFIDAQAPSDTYIYKCNGVTSNKVKYR